MIRFKDHALNENMLTRAIHRAVVSRGWLSKSAKTAHDRHSEAHDELHKLWGRKPTDKEVAKRVAERERQLVRHADRKKAEAEKKAEKKAEKPLHPDDDDVPVMSAEERDKFKKSEKAAEEARRHEQRQRYAHHRAQDEENFRRRREAEPKSGQMFRPVSTSGDRHAGIGRRDGKAAEIAAKTDQMKTNANLAHHEQKMKAVNKRKAEQEKHPVTKRRRTRLRQIAQIQQERPHVPFHAAAHHVIAGKPLPPERK